MNYIVKNGYKNHKLASLKRYVFCIQHDAFIPKNWLIPCRVFAFRYHSCGCFAFYQFSLSVCKASLRRYDAPGRRGHLDRGGFARRRSLHVKNVFVQESGTMAPIKISVYMKFASLYHGQQLCSCDSASLKRFVKSTWVSNYMLPKKMTLSERKRVMAFLSVFLI